MEGLFLHRAGAVPATEVVGELSSEGEFRGEDPNWGDAVLCAVSHRDTPRG
jgi:hypothetical protein